MKAGSGLNELVAEKVMGWHRRKRDQRWLDKNNRPVEWICPECGQHEFEPSQRIDDAWMVLGKFQDAEIEWEHGDHSTATIHKAGAGWFSAHAEDAPLAICLAALKTVGYDDAL